MTLRKSQLDGNVETILLSILDEQPNYGYEIVSLLNERTEGLLNMGEGTVYPVLHRLEKRKLISSYWDKAGSGRPRKYYRVTPAGAKALGENREQWADLVRVMETFLGPRDKSSDSNSKLSPGGAVS